MEIDRGRQNRAGAGPARLRGLCRQMALGPASGVVRCEHQAAPNTPSGHGPTKGHAFLVRGVIARRPWRAPSMSAETPGCLMRRSVESRK